MASVRIDTVKHGAHYVSETTWVPLFTFGGRPQLVGDQVIDNLCGVENSHSTQGG